MVAVGALIAYLAENGRLSQFRLNIECLKKKVLPTTEYIGVISAQTGTLDCILTPEINGAYKEVSAFPIPIGTKQFDVDGYPANLLYMLKFNDKEIRKAALAAVRKQAGLPEDAQESLIAPDKVLNEMDVIKFRMRKNSPLRIRLEREYHEDKEYVKIDSVEDSERNDLPVKYFELALQTWSEDSTNWLDTGVFKLHIGI
jgi:hypothetical protein